MSRATLGGGTVIHAGAQKGRTLLNEAIEAHGGAERWEALQEITARIRSGGPVKWWGTKRWIPTNYEVRIWPAEPRVIITPFSGTGRRGIFDADGSVHIESNDGTPISARTHPRKGTIRRLFSWDALDALHFGGYAYWNYLCFPFLLLRRGVQVWETEPRGARRKGWRCLRVVFPRDTPTHSREQRFYFDSDRLLRRFDYSLDRVGGWAKGAHYVSDYREFDGLLIPTRRWVRWRLLPYHPLLTPRFYWFQLQRLDLVYKAAPELTAAGRY